MKKRGVELSMNVIIIAAIALIVLVILILLVTRAGQNTDKTQQCTAQPGGQCLAATSPAPVGKVRASYQCPTTTPACYINAPV